MRGFPPGIKMRQLSAKASQQSSDYPAQSNYQHNCHSSSCLRLQLYSLVNFAATTTILINLICQHVVQSATIINHQRQLQSSSTSTGDSNRLTGHQQSNHQGSDQSQNHNNNNQPMFVAKLADSDTVDHRRNNTDKLNDSSEWTIRGSKLAASAPPMSSMQVISEQEKHVSNSSGHLSVSGKLIAPLAGLESSALNYLQKYGYMSNSNGPSEKNNLITEESFSAAVEEFQRFAGLPATGFVDQQTLELMKLPRCGNSDKWQANSSKSSQLQSNLNHATMDLNTNEKLTRPATLIENQVNSAHNVGHQKQQQTTRMSSLSGNINLINISPTTTNYINNNTSSAIVRRKKRYALQGSKWRRQELTYRISQYPTRFAGKRHEVDGQIARAFGIWSQVAPIDFVVKKEGRVHIDIRFASGDHGDGDAFDGPGNTLAHAYFPQYGGDAHFDDQEYWTINSYAGTNIFQVAAHELGHSLGLGHSNVREALMAPFYQKYKPNFKLHMDDILAIQALYGEKPLSSETPAPTTISSTTTTSTSTTTTTTTTTTPRPPFLGGRYPIYKGAPEPSSSSSDEYPPPPPPPSQSPGRRYDPSESDSDSENKIYPDLFSNGIGGDTGDTGSPDYAPFADLCLDPKVDAITRTEDGNSYVFKGDLYWLLAQEGLARGYPRLISQDWDNLPGKLDAALTWADGKTFFFKGNKYWRFRNKRRDVGYPKLISAGFAGIPDDIDAAFVWSGNGRTYIIKGAEYWRFDSKSDPPVSSEYPRSIKVWSGLPDRIDSAFKWENNVTYFFKGNQYYRFNDREFKVEARGRPPFPRPTSEWWFGCVNSNLAQRALPSGSRESRMAITTTSGEQHQHQQQQQHARPRASTLIGAQANQQQQPTSNDNLDDWSFLAKFEGQTNKDPRSSWGTHVNDRRPVFGMDPANEDAADAIGPEQAKTIGPNADASEEEQVLTGHHKQPEPTAGPDTGNNNQHAMQPIGSANGRPPQWPFGTGFRLGVSEFSDPDISIQHAASSAGPPTSTAILYKSSHSNYSFLSSQHLIGLLVSIVSSFSCNQLSYQATRLATICN